MSTVVAMCTGSSAYSVSEVEAGRQAVANEGELAAAGSKVGELEESLGESSAQPGHRRQRARR